MENHRVEHRKTKSLGLNENFSCHRSKKIDERQSSSSSTLPSSPRKFEKNPDEEQLNANASKSIDNQNNHELIWSEINPIESKTYQRSSETLNKNKSE